MLIVGSSFYFRTVLLLIVRHTYSEVRKRYELKCTIPWLNFEINVNCSCILYVSPECTAVMQIHFRSICMCHALVDATLVRGQEFAKVLRVSTKIR